MDELRFTSDEEMQEHLRSIAPIWAMLQTEQQELDSARTKLLREFEEQHAPKIQMIAVLKAKIDAAYQALNEYINTETIVNGRKKFLDGRISTRIVRYAGEYDPVALRVWARKYSDTLRPVSDKDKKQMVVETLLRTAPELLEVDDKAAEKLAIQTYYDGAPVFEDSPVPIEVRATKTSEDLFAKILSTLAIEVEYDRRNS